jgi:hypothetical protein
VQTSTLFDSDWYLQSYPDVAQAGIDPLLHYLGPGWREGRDPGPEFATSAYLKAYSDVARSGINPLVHYIEFGHSEGREAFGHRRPFERRAAPVFDLPAPAPCISFPVKRVPPVRWSRSYRLDRKHPRSVVAEDWVVGYAFDDSARRAFEEAFSCLSFVSGYGAPTGGADGFQETTSERLADAWYVTATRLRTRYNGGNFPFVIRAFQHDPLQDGSLSLVGERLISSPLDALDLDLANAFFPLLFIVADPDGALRSSFKLVFPSLCRGELHYSESLWASRDSRDVDPFAESERLATRLLRCLVRQDDFALGEVVVDLNGADGSGPLFQSDFKAWLERVVRIGVRPRRGADESPASRFLAEAVSSASSAARSGKTTLLISHDMVPTIRALTEPLQRSESGDRDVFAPLLVAGADAAQPATWVELPRPLVTLLEALPESRSMTWPRLTAAGRAEVPDDFPAAAIRHRNRKELSDAELLVPVGGDEFADRIDKRQPITWIIQAEGWRDGQLEQSIESLALQIGSDKDTLALVGPVGSKTIEIANNQFDGRVIAFADFSAAARKLSTPFAALIGAGVFLHDRHSALVLSALLQNEAVATASSVLISVERRGKTWHAAIADGGSFATGTGASFGEPDPVRLTEELWGATFPVRAPSPQFWVARSSDAAKWLSERGLFSPPVGLHLCTSALTISSIGQTTTAMPPEIVPPVRNDRATRAGTLYG